MRKLIKLDSVDSTNTYLLNYTPGEGEGQTVAVAEEQTAGRGQGTNQWESERGKNLLFSVLIHPAGVAPVRQFCLSMAAALALKDTLDALTGGISLKWPNDIYWHDRKLCGILIETRLKGNTIADCVFGIGLNVNQQRFRSDAPNPVSLCQVLGRELQRDELLRQILRNLDNRLSQIYNGNDDALRKDYHHALYRLGETHNYLLPDGQTIRATLTGVAPDGHLQLSVQTPAGAVGRSFAFKEIAFEIAKN
mgnify:CR=1 FL=1